MRNVKAVSTHLFPTNINYFSEVLLSTLFQILVLQMAGISRLSV
jgi:hypothetical protein